MKWMDWSSIDRLVLYNGDGSKSTDRVLGFTDGWTVKAGIGHQFNEKLSLVVRFSGIAELVEATLITTPLRPVVLTL